MSERPLKIRHDTEGRLHSDSGPAMAFGDGFTTYAWHGVTVDRDVIEAPDRITVAMIDKESNAERRRVMVERFGADRMVREGGAELIDADATGKLWLRKMPFDYWQREPVVVVEVENSTPEADGSRKTYFLRVPPTTKTAREAVAWTFGMRAERHTPPGTACRSIATSSKRTTHRGRHDQQAVEHQATPSGRAPVATAGS